MPSRVLFIRQHMGPVGEGTSARGWEQVGRLAAEGHDVTLVTGRAIAPDEAPRGVRVRSLATSYEQEMGFLQRKLAFIAFAVKALAVVLRQRYDVVFASSTPLTVFIPAMAAKVVRPSTRLVLEVRDLWPALPIAVGALTNPLERGLARQLESISYRMADQVIALSPGMATEIRRVSGKESVVISNGSSRSAMRVEPSEAVRLRADLDLPPGAKLVLYAGSIGTVNDPAYLAALVRTTTTIDPSVYFVIVGSGPGHDALRSQLAGIPVVRMVARVPRSEVVRYFSLADLSLVTFVSEPLMETNSANKFFDSLAAGCPMAVNYGGWHAELLAESGAGLRLSRDPAEAAGSVARVLGEPHTLAGMATAAIELAERFEWAVLYPPWRRALLGVA